MGTRKLKVIIQDRDTEEDYKPRKNTVKVYIEARHFNDYDFVGEDETMLMVSQDVDEYMLLNYLIDQNKDNVWFYIDPMAVPEVEVFFRGLFDQYADAPAKDK